MELSTSIKTAASVVIAIGTVFFASTASAHNNSVENYLDAVVTAHVAQTKAEIANQSEEQVLTANHRFTLDSDESEELVAKVTVTYLTKADVKQNGAE